MYRYGFELEGFCIEQGNIVLPPVGYPVDGFPGLVELRTVGGASLEEAFTGIVKELVGRINNALVFFNVNVGTFSPDQKRELRKRQGAVKSPADIRNIYGKKPKALSNKTIASLQINISDLRVKGWTQNVPHKGDETYTKIIHSDIYGQLDVPRIVTALDKAFEKEIKDSGRQPGEYCIKGDRLEYRSLPNFCFPGTYQEAKPFLDKIKKAVEN